MLPKSFSEAMNIKQPQTHRNGIFHQFRGSKELKETGSLCKAGSDEIKCLGGPTAVFSNKIVEAYRVHLTRAFRKRQLQMKAMRLRGSPPAL
jgi:hypothetical protein